MEIVIVCTEGESTETAMINAVTDYFQAQTATNVKAQVIPLSTEGNQGHVHLVEKANQAVNDYIRSLPESEEIRIREKYLMCDYDKMNEHGIALENLRRKCDDNEFALIVSNPDIEYFVARHFFDAEELTEVTAGPKMIEKINEGIKEYNSRADTFMKLPKYGKRKKMANDFFSALYNYDPTFLDIAKNISTVASNGRYTEVPVLLAELYDFLLEAATE